MQINKDIYCIFFERTNPFDFISGQYIQMILPHEHSDERGTTRFFTIASSPTEKDVMITTRKGRSSFKKELFALKQGAAVQFFGPIGTFTFPKD